MANGNQAQAQSTAAPSNASPAGQTGSPTGEEKKPNWIKWVIIALIVIAVVAGIWLFVG